ncbi:MAG: hypothetical protein GX088_08440 [Clostridia bacterium]|nr:hypothetical protein [Clostridia bacterium]
MSSREVNKNNKILIIAMVVAFLVIILVACTTPTMTELTDEEIMDLYNKAKEAYGWFDLTTIPFDSEKYIEINGEKYYEVVQPGITSKKVLADYLNEFFTENITEGLMAASSNRYVERDGKLYVLPADRGTDIFKGEESYELSRVSDNQIKLMVKVEIYDDPDKRNVIDYEQYDYLLELTDNGWRFKNFQLVR